MYPRSRRSNNPLSSTFDLRTPRPARIFDLIFDSKEEGCFEEGKGCSSKKGRKVLRSSGPKIEKHPFFDLRTRSSKNLPSSIFDLRGRRSKKPVPSSIFGPGDRRSDGRRGGVGLHPPKNEEPASSTFSARRTKIPPSSIFSVGRMDEKPSGTFSSDPHPSPPRPSAPLSYPEVRIFKPIFHVEDRSEDRDRPSTRSSILNIEEPLIFDLRSQERVEDRTEDGRGFDFFEFPDMPCMKRVCKDK